VHLKTIKLRGFKSFVDPVEVRLEPGVAVVVGPNGSGKSNISDSILWATGSLSPHELRAEKPDDVLFAGSNGRAAVDFCEVELIFDNEDGAWPDLPFAEVSLARRLHRGGEGRYLVNRAAVRRIDLVELLSDVGLGGGLRSVISQGSVESVLGAKPPERRALIEEAAGLGRFKLRRHRAELKLARVAIQVERARDLEEEVRKRLRPLALQATAAERAAKLAEELRRIQAAIATLDLLRLDERRAMSEQARAAASVARVELDAKLQQLLAARSRAEEELTDAAGIREAAIAALYRLRAGAERLSLRRESAEGLALRFRADLEAAKEFDPARSGQLVAAARAAAAAAQRATSDRAACEARAEEAWAMVAGAEQSKLAILGGELDELSATRVAVEHELVGSGRNALLAIRDAAQRIEFRREAVTRLRSELDRDLVEARAGSHSGPTPAELGRAADAADAAARAAARERDDLRARAELARERLATLEQALAEREGLPPAARALAEGGERLALSLLDVKPGDERAVAAALGRLASAIVVDEAGRGLQLLREARSAGLGSVVVLVGRDPAEIVSGLPVVEPDELLASPVAAVTREGIGWDPGSGELWFAGETAEAVLLELEARRSELVEEAATVARAAAEAEATAAAAAVAARSAAEAFEPVKHLRTVRRRDPEALARIAGCAGRLDETLRLAAAIAVRVEEPLAVRSSSAADDLREVARRESDLRRSMAEVEARLREAEKRARNRSVSGAGDPDLLREEAEALAQLALQAAAVEGPALERAAAASRALAEAEGSLGARVSTFSLERLAGLAARFEASLAVEVARFEQPLHDQVAADAVRTTQLGNDLRRLGAEEVELRSAASAAAERVSSIDVELARTGAEHDDAMRRLEEADAEPAEGDDRGELAARL